MFRQEDFRPVRDISRDDLLTWEIQFAREGTLPVEAQRRLLAKVLGDRHAVIVPITKETGN